MPKPIPVFKNKYEAKAGEELDTGWDPHARSPLEVPSRKNRREQILSASAASGHPGGYCCGSAEMIGAHNGQKCSATKVVNGASSGAAMPNVLSSSGER